MHFKFAPNANAKQNGNETRKSTQRERERKLALCHPGYRRCPGLTHIAAASNTNNNNSIYNNINSNKRGNATNLVGVALFILSARRWPHSAVYLLMLNTHKQMQTHTHTHTQIHIWGLPPTHTSVCILIVLCALFFGSSFVYTWEIVEVPVQQF